MTKTILHSHRGLTFSFPSKGKMSIGCQYDYVIDKKSQSIRIVPSDSGKYRFSRKRAGEKWNSLVDLRNKEILDAVSACETLQISFTEDAVIVSCKKAKKRSGGVLLKFPRIVLSDMRMAAGLSDIAASERILAYEQITFDEYLASLQSPISVDTIQKDLPDVYTLVSLFSGAGILDWPFFNDSRFNIKYAIDYDAAACATYRQNIGTHIVHGDIHRAFTDNGYPQDTTVHNPDIVIGGPSCKPFSNANRHTRLEDHPDSDLVVQYMRIIKTLKPKVFAMENVPAVLTACDGAYFKAIQNAANECGYTLEARIVQDCKVGGYTTRKRAIILGSRIGPAKFNDLEVKSGFKTVKNAFDKMDSSWSNLEDVTIPGEDTRLRMSYVPQGGNYTSIPEEYQTPGKNRHSCTYRRLALDEPSPTIVNWRKPPLIHPTGNRTLSVAEAKALQGLPGSFRICGGLSAMQQQVGNSVPVALGQYIKASLLGMLNAQPKAHFA